MSENNDSNSFWTDARPADRGWMARGQANVNAYYAARQQPAEPDVAEPEPVDYTMGLEQYAEQRAALGIKQTNDFGVVVQENRSGFPDASTRIGREHLAATGIPVPPTAMHPAGRVLDQDYQSTQHLSASQTSLGAAPTTSRTIRTINPK